MLTVIVDGYNLIYQFPELRRILERDLDTARQGLLDRIGLYASEKHVRAVVVFDGDGRVMTEPEKRPEVKVVYSRPPEKADPVIKKMIEKDHDKDIVIVTSDREIVNYARLYSVKTISSNQFAHEMLVKPKNEVEKKFDFPMSQNELDEWLHLFDEKNSTEEEIG